MIAEFEVVGAHFSPSEIYEVGRLLDHESIPYTLSGSSLASKTLNIVDGKLVSGYSYPYMLAILVKVRHVLRKMGLKAIIYSGEVVAGDKYIGVRATLSGNVLLLKVSRKKNYYGYMKNPETFVDSFIKTSTENGLELKRIILSQKMDTKKRLF
ncbi:MAG: hypothetical protein JHC26_07390 [Thermofilum sp.]|jgi:hypothetical protein|uniref:hypothetical protein n=1 Tax=Thermofilum sp. TaxID=1961369 RepID=UPI002587413F|nr:hypothetical protein [Thermofilum sp.]MCI4408900.1 hypothetical protein [Thermofilum sp.]